MGSRSYIIYRCAECHRMNCQLWRQYQTFLDRIKLLCTTCAKKDQKQEREGDSIGWLVPAVPTILPLWPGGKMHPDSSFWGYTSVPEDGVNWWRALPV